MEETSRIEEEMNLYGARVLVDPKMVVWTVVRVMRERANAAGRRSWARIDGAIGVKMVG